MPVINQFRLAENRMEAIKKFHHDVGIPRAELDVSGGVDSAVMLKLLTGALGSDNVTAVYIGINSDPNSLERAREVAHSCGVPLVELDLSVEYDMLRQKILHGLEIAGFDKIRQRADVDPTIYGSFRSCLRAPVGRFCNRLTGNGIRHGTGNEDEDRWLRFYQKGGDGEVDTNPIAMLTKGEVFQLARYLQVPSSILNARPSPDLWGAGSDHSDEDEIRAYLNIPASYTGSMYSYIDMKTGLYKNVGLIEWISRWVDNDYPFKNGAPYPIPGLDPDLSDKIIQSAIRAERISRHKENPNIPTLGTRQSLLVSGCLTNDLTIHQIEFTNNAGLVA